MTSWAMVSRAGNGRRTDRSQSLVRLSEDIGRGGAWGQGGRLQESCQSDHHSVVTHTENPALFMVEVTGVLRNHILNPRRTLDDLRPGAESPASPCTVLIRHCIIPRQSSPYIRQVPFLPTSCKRAAVIFGWH